MLIYPYYKLFEADINKLVGLIGSEVVIQKKYPPENTVVITYDSGKILVGNKRLLDIPAGDSQFRIKRFDEDYFIKNENHIYYGSILNRSIVLWDVYDKYNNRFLDSTLHIGKYRAYEYYRGKFTMEIYNRYSDNYIYRFRSPMLTYLVKNV